MGNHAALPAVGLRSVETTIQATDYPKVGVVERNRMQDLVEFKPKFDLQDARYWAQRFAQGVAEEQIEHEVAARIRRQGYLAKPDFLLLARWKSPRSEKRYAANSDDFVREVTRVALSTSSEQLRIEVLTLLNGVGWPTASTILHFSHREPYPILDFRALWSLGYDVVPPYTFEFWLGYTTYTRAEAERYGLTMRELDKALWQFSKEHQAPRD